MLALLLTFLAAAFVLGPDFLSRWVLGFVVPRRSLSQSKGEEVTRAVLWAFAPLALVLLWVKCGHILSMWGGWPNVQLVVSGLYSNASFDKHEGEFYQSLYKVGGMAWSLLWRLYFLVLLFALALNLVTIRYRWLRSRIKYGWMKAGLATIVLPRVSEWHVLLSDMLLPLDDVFLAVDVLTKSGTLYAGKVQDRMLAPDGTLQTLTLADTQRFLREDFKKAKDADRSTKTSDFWRLIPGKLFVIIGSDIASVNVRYPPRTATKPLTRDGLSEAELQALKNLLSKLTSPAPRSTTMVEAPSDS